MTFVIGDDIRQLVEMVEHVEVVRGERWERVALHGALEADDRADLGADVLEAVEVDHARGLKGGRGDLEQLGDVGVEQAEIGQGGQVLAEERQEMLAQRAAVALAEVQDREQRGPLVLGVPGEPVELRREQVRLEEEGCLLYTSPSPRDRG